MLTALGLLVGAKVLNVCVPYLFKVGVDTLSTASTVTGTVDTVSNFAIAILVGCEFILQVTKSQRCKL